MRPHKQQQVYGSELATEFRDELPKPVEGSISQEHRLLLSFYQDHPLTMWELAEEDPEQVRFITDDGEETISSRFAGAGVDAGLGDFTERFGQELLSEKRECLDCQFFSRCGGYFKWPDRTYDCQGVKALFGKMKDAADQVKGNQLNEAAKNQKESVAGLKQSRFNERPIGCGKRGIQDLFGRLRNRCRSGCGYRRHQRRVRRLIDIQPLLYGPELGELLRL